MEKLLSYPLSVVYYFCFGLCLVIFHPIQWICINVFGYQAHKKSVDYPKGRHVIFGYLQIGEIHELNTDADYNALPDFTQYHSHANKHFIENDGKARSNNCIYIASEKLSFNNDLPGGGTFNYNETRVLTKKGRNKSMWELPDFFKNLNITYHKNESFINDYFQSAAKGQEFVIQEDPKLSEWVKEVIEG